MKTTIIIIGILILIKFKYRLEFEYISESGIYVLWYTYKGRRDFIVLFNWY